MVKPASLQLWLLAGAATLAHGRVLRPRILRPRDTTYSASVRDASLFGFFGQVLQTTTVDSGVTYWLSGQGPHAFFGNIDNSGDIIVSQTDSILGTGGIVSTPLSVTYATTSIIDGILTTRAGSLISLNDFGDVSLVAPSLYNWGLYSMQNAGTLQWCGNGAPPTGSTFTLTCSSSTCVNNGLITWEQYNNNFGVLFNWAAGVNVGATSFTSAGFNPTNNGAFRLINTDLQITQDVLSTVSGGGCFVLGTGSALSLLTGTQGATAGTQTFAGQSIYFTSSSAGLYISPAVYSLNQNFGAKLYGFGTGNYLSFTEVPLVAVPFTSIVPFSYSGSTLTVNFIGGRKIAINIGTGYTASLFAQTVGPPDLLRNPTAVTGIIYNGAAPARALPPVCAVSYPVCADPAVTVRAVFASTIGVSSSVSTPAVSTSLDVSTSLPITTSLPDTTALPTSTSIGVTVPTTTGAAPGTTTVFVTTTSTSFGLDVPFTTTIPPAETGAGTVTGTVEVVTPAALVTVTTISGTAAPFTTTIAPNGAAPGTVLIVNPATYVTVTAGAVGASSTVTYTVQPTGTEPGTVVIVQPTNTNTITSTVPYTGTNIYTSAVTYSTAQPSGTAPAVVFVSIVDAVLVTRTLPYTGSVTITTTVAATDGSQPTVEILTPTISRPAVISTTIGPNRCECRPRTTCAA